MVDISNESCRPPLRRITFQEPIVRAPYLPLELIKKCAISRPPELRDVTIMPGQTAYGTNDPVCYRAACKYLDVIINVTVHTGKSAQARRR